ncbi:MAG: hypothetical protein WD669_11275 [Pirellulales bacterium]
MNPRRRFRFSLAALLLTVTAACFFLGYARWRREWMLKEINALRTEGVIVDVKNDWIDRLWLRTGQYAWVHIVEVSPEKRQLGSKVYEFRNGDGSEPYQSLEQRCYALGVKDVVLTATTREELERLMESDNSQ